MTAVNWLVEKLNSKYGNDDFIITHINEIEQAKEMEKQQMEESFTEGYKSGIADYMDIQNGYDGRAIGFSQYYNEKYGSKGSEHDEDNLEEIISKSHTNITRRKGKEYAPTSNEIQAEIDKSEKPINTTSSQTEISDEEIEKAALEYFADYKGGANQWEISAFIMGMKKYREQLKSK